MNTTSALALSRRVGLGICYGMLLTPTGQELWATSAPLVVNESFGGDFGGDDGVRRIFGRV